MRKQKSFCKYMCIKRWKKTKFNNLVDAGVLGFFFVFVFPLGLIFMFEIIYEKPRIPFGIEGTIFKWSVYQWLNWLTLHQTLLSKHLSLQKVHNLPAIKNFFSQDHTEQFFQNEKAGKIKVKDKSSPSRGSTLLLLPSTRCELLCYLFF